MNAAAFELGRQTGSKTDYLAKKDRKAILDNAGLDICVVCQDFEAGRAAGIAERKESERAEREAKAAENARLSAKHEAMAEAVRREQLSHRGEELHDYATRKRFENIGLDEAAPRMMSELDKIDQDFAS